MPGMALSAGGTRALQGFWLSWNLLQPLTRVTKGKHRPMRPHNRSPYSNLRIKEGVLEEVIHSLYLKDE